MESKYEMIISELEAIESGDLKYDDGLEFFEWYLNDNGELGFTICNIAVDDFFKSIESVYVNAFSDFAEDIIISLLQDVINDIGGYFSKQPKTRRNNWREHYYELYYDHIDIFKIIEEIDKIKLKSLEEKFYDVHALERQIPKVMSPFFIFLAFETLYCNGTNLLNLSKKYIGLKSTRSKSGTEFEVFYTTYESHVKFVSILEKLKAPNETNVSLTLLQYNLETDFLDTIFQMMSIKDNKKAWDTGFSEMPGLIWKLEMSINEKLCNYFESSYDIKNFELIFNVAKNNLKQFLLNSLIESNTINEFEKDNSDFLFLINYYQLFSRFSYREANLKKIENMIKINVTNNKWIESYIRSYQLNYRKKSQ